MRTRKSRGVRGADRVVIEDLEARYYAKAMGLRIIGPLGVVKDKGSFLLR